MEDLVPGQRSQDLDPLYAEALDLLEAGVVGCYHGRFHLGCSPER